jgi:hypothetical protein
VQASAPRPTQHRRGLRGWHIALIVVAGIGGTIVWALGLGFLVSLSSERGTFSDYAVANEQGGLTLHVRECFNEIVGKVTIGSGTDPNARAIITIAKRSGSIGTAAVALDRATSGYTRTGIDLVADRTFVVTSVEDPRGGPLVATIVTFRPDTLADGDAESNNDGRTRISDWLAESARCHR